MVSAKTHKHYQQNPYTNLEQATTDHTGNNKFKNPSQTHNKWIATEKQPQLRVGVVQTPEFLWVFYDVGFYGGIDPTATGTQKD